MAQGDSFGHRATRALIRFLTVVGALALLAVVAVLLSELNARTFTVEVQDGRLVVMKGRHLPVGAAPYQPGDAALSDAYAPIPLEGATPPGTLLTQRFRDRDELDRALFEVLEQQATSRIVNDDPAVVEKGFYYLSRAERLGGLSSEQRDSLKRMQVEVSYYQARFKLDEARRLIAEAMAQLKLAGTAQNKHARNANQMLIAIEPATKNLEEALRSAVHQLSQPASAEKQQEPPQEQPVVAPAVDAGTP